MNCQVVGRWRIVEADLWDRDHLDLVEPAMMTIRANGHGEIAFGAMQASLDLEYSRSMVFFTWAGCHSFGASCSGCKRQRIQAGGIAGSQSSLRRPPRHSRMERSPLLG